MGDEGKACGRVARSFYDGLNYPGRTLNKQVFTHDLRVNDLGDLQSFNLAAVLEMFAEDLIDVGLVDEGIPSTAGIDDADGAVLATVHAARAVDARLATTAMQVEGLGLFLGVLKQGRGDRAATLTAVVAFVEAEKEVIFVKAHGWRSISVYFLAEPRACSTGYFWALRASLSSAAVRRSMFKQLAMLMR